MKIAAIAACSVLVGCLIALLSPDARSVATRDFAATHLQGRLADEGQKRLLGAPPQRIEGHRASGTISNARPSGPHLPARPTARLLNTSLLQTHTEVKDGITLELTPEEVWEEEDTNHVWTQEITNEVRTAIDDLSINGALREIDCRTTACRVHLEFADESNARRLDEALGGEGRLIQFRSRTDEQGSLLVDALIRR